MITKNIKTLFAFVLIMIYGNSYSQPSYGFSVWFNLADKQGKKISVNEFSSLNTYVPYGSVIVIQYDTIADMYNLKGESVNPTSSLVLISYDDTTVIEFSVDKGYICLGNIAIDGNTYNFIFDDRSVGKYKCGEKLYGHQNKRVCKTIKPLSSFKVEETLEQNEQNLENQFIWQEIKLENN